MGCRPALQLELFPERAKGAEEPPSGANITMYDNRCAAMARWPGHFYPPQLIETATASESSAATGRAARTADQLQHIYGTMRGHRREPGRLQGACKEAEQHGGAASASELDTVQLPRGDRSRL